MNVFLAILCEFLPGVIVLSGHGQRMHSCLHCEFIPGVIVLSGHGPLMYSCLHCVSFFQVLLCCPAMVSECILGYTA